MGGFSNDDDVVGGPAGARMTIRRLHLICSLFAAFFFVAPSVAPGQTLIDDSLFAPSLGRTKHFDIELPAGYSDTSHYPLLVLLHGYGGNYRNWFEFTDIAAYAASLQVLILTPEGDDSWYVNHIGDSEARYEDYIIHDLLPFVQKLYGVDTSLQVIGGVSMGGYGSLVLGLRHPDIFRAILAFSSSLDIPKGIPLLETAGRGVLRPSLEQALGARPSRTWTEYDPFLLASHLDSARAPYVYLANGIHDEFARRLLLHREFADTLRAHGIPYEYHETPGRHAWKYWDREIQVALERLEKLWKRRKKP